jgi:hypothetical protein
VPDRVSGPLHRRRILVSSVPYLSSVPYHTGSRRHPRWQ